VGIGIMSRDFAKQLRRNMTSEEWHLWHAVKAKRLAGAKFRRQAPIGPYVADFVCVAARLVVEIDGSQHGERVEADADRTRYLEAKGYRVLRVWNNDVAGNLDGVIRMIECALRDAPTSPSSG
jgi:very-short-patch-repair endonuclease